MNTSPEQLGRAITLTAAHMREVEQAIRAAVLAERERCAQVAESFIPSGFEGSFGVARDDRARTIAAKIREG